MAPWLGPPVTIACLRQHSCCARCNHSAHGVRPWLPAPSGSAPASSSVRSRPIWFSLMAQISGPSGEAAACLEMDVQTRAECCAVRHTGNCKLAFGVQLSPGWTGPAAVAPAAVHPAAAALPLRLPRFRLGWRSRRQQLARRAEGRHSQRLKSEAKRARHRRRIGGGPQSRAARPGRLLTACSASTVCCVSLLQRGVPKGAQASLCCAEQERSRPTRPLCRL